MKTYLLDANVVVRFLTQTPPGMGAAAKRLFASTADGKTELHLTLVIAAEVVFVLTKVYAQNRTDVANALLDLAELPGIRVDDATVLRDSLHRFKSVAVDFADALLAAMAAQTHLPIASFDADLDKFRDVTRFEPR